MRWIEFSFTSWSQASPASQQSQAIHLNTLYESNGQDCLDVMDYKNHKEHMLHVLGRNGLVPFPPLDVSSSLRSWRFSKRLASMRAIATFCSGQSKNQRNWKTGICPKVIGAVFWQSKSTSGGDMEPYQSSIAVEFAQIWLITEER